MKGLVLFDIDNTLIETPNAHKMAFSEAFKKVYDINCTIDIINYYGMTDQQVIIEVLKKKGLKEAQILANLGECMESMLEYFSRIENTMEIKVFDGVVQLLEKLENQNFLLGLVTGNLEFIAKSKMKRANLNRYFKLGAFGSDDVERAKLVKLAIKRAEENFNFKYKRNVFLIGDTPKDIEAGNSSGAITIGVATGIYTRKDLENTSADYVIENFRNTQKILDLIFIR